MPPTQPRFHGRAPLSARSAVPLPRPSSAGPILPRALKIMVAGVDKDARGAIEATVLQALGPRAASGPWSISVVSLAGKWSVTLDGPDDRLRGVSFMADSSRLGEAIREAIQVEQAGTTRASSTSDLWARAPTEARDRHVCEHCGKDVLVVYELRPDEKKELAPLACPHCWKIWHVEVGVWAAAGREYRAEKA